MASWDDFLPDVLAHCPSAPIPTVRRALRRAARKFCSRTYAWKAWLPCVQTVDPATEFTPTLPTGAEALRIEKATMNGDPITVTQFHVPEKDWTDEDIATGLERQVITDDLVTFTLAGTVTSGAVVRARVALQPTRSAAACNFELLATRYFEAIVDGALAELFRIKGATFGDPDEAAKFAGMFEAHIGRAIIDVSRGGTGQRARLRPHWF